MELWKDIIGYEGLYQVSSLGRVKSLRKLHGNCLRKETILNQYLTRKKYYKVLLSKNKILKNKEVHRLVAETFLDKRKYKSMPDEDKNLIKLDKLEVNHIDENKTNNCLENLEWCTRKYNANYGTRGIRGGKKIGKKILQYNKNGELIREWESIKEATEKLHICSIGKNCRGKSKTAGGFIWKFKEVK